MSITDVKMGPALAATGSTDAVLMSGQPFSVQAFGTTTAGAGTATVIVEGSNHASPSLDGHWVTLATLSLSFTTAVGSDAGGSVLPYLNVRARVSAISGTGASISFQMAKGKSA